MGPGSNLGRSLRIERVRVKGARGRLRGSPEQELPRRRFTGAGETGATELGLDRGLVQKRERGTCNLLGLRSGLDRGSGGVRDGAGGASSPASGGVRPGTRYGYVILRKRTRRLRRRLPSLESDGEVAQGRKSGRTGGGARRGSRGGEDSARPWTGVGDGGLRVVAGPEAEPVRCLAGLWCGGEVRPRRRGALLRAETRRRLRLGFEGGQ